MNLADPPVQPNPYWLGRLSRALVDMNTTIARRGMASDPDVRAYGSVLGDFMALGSLVGALQQQLDAEWVARGGTGPSPVQAWLPSLPFEQALADLASRRPQVARNAADVRRIYRDHGFSLARATSLDMVERVRDIITRSRREGVSRSESIDAMAELGGWTRGYAETVYRTNVATVQTEGRMAQAQKTRDLVPAFEFLTARDRDVRGAVAPKAGEENHAALHGFIASVDSPVWQTWAPPLGYNCRCTLRPVGIAELEARGLIDADGNVKERPVPGNARKHPGFGGFSSRR